MGTRALKHIPNILSIGRIVLSLSLLFFVPLSMPFFIVYFACGFSDVLDGFIARKYEASSILGAKLDTFADLLMVLIILAIFLPLVETTQTAIMLILFVGMIKVVSLITVRVRFHQTAFLHTWLNKGIGLLVFLYPFTLPFNTSFAGITSLSVIAVIAAVEELIIMLTCKKFNPDRTHLFQEETISNNL